MSCIYKIHNFQIPCKMSYLHRNSPCEKLNLVWNRWKGLKETNVKSWADRGSRETTRHCPLLVPVPLHDVLVQQAEKA